MNVIDLILTWFSALSFLFYGLSFYTSGHMKDEFKRYGLEKFALLTSILQMLGGIGLIVGLLVHPILLISSAGLSILMLFGFSVRLKIKDGFWQSLPALSYFMLNSYLFYSGL
ncbi:DoxX-like family protein [Daejeonella rubra]|uniref:DoxX-like family protein n=1 Tax=Daejeonella rubra TaxID=990371 RepID=A0A1G9R667_9SPHI|nr:DoxX family protein [Daejeonella rubra]SDM18769.1 DoxX-like family protein [Daejeonella rubra]